MKRPYAPISLLAAVLLPVLAGCSPAPMPVSQSPADPSSPNAPEGSTPPPAAAAAPASGHEDHDHHAHGGDADAGAVVYACPMHPEVTSNEPGHLCPKCNMKLVPKK